MENNYSLVKSTLNVKRYFPEASPMPYCELDYVVNPDGTGELTLWHGRAYTHCEEKWGKTFKTTRFKRCTFTIPGIPATFLLLSGKIYMRDQEVK